jgi:hypothetical protein
MISSLRKGMSMSFKRGMYVCPNAATNRRAANFIFVRNWGAIGFDWVTNKLGSRAVVDQLAT